MASLAQTKFGSVPFRILREQGAGAFGLPEWQPRRRLVSLDLANGGVYRQDLGALPSQLTLQLELETGDDVQALWAKLGTVDTLRLRYGIGSIAGASVFIIDGTYQNIANVTLADIQPVGQALNGSFRVRATFERDGS